MADIYQELNDNQREAVTYIDGPSLVIAGAGSGKTRVLTCKIAYLLERGWHPSSILSLTFTNKAAREMRERISRMVGAELAARLWMGTFHSVFYRILRAEAELLGFTPNFTIYDTADSKALIKAILKENSLDEKVYKPSLVLAVISKAKNRLVTAEQYSRSAECRRADMHMNMPRMADIFIEYSRRCRMSNVMDFDDLLLYTHTLFERNPEVCARYRERFSYILVDEYQDTNYAQHAVIWQLAGEHQHLCVVGDDAQSIYSFRGAEIENILGFTRQYSNARIFKLEQNYRSTQMIVKAANSLIAHNQRQIPKDVFSCNAPGEQIHVLSAYSDLEEGELVASRMERLVTAKGMSYSDFAILYRTNAQSRIFEEAFRRKGIPYRIYGGLSFYQRKEIKDIISYCRMLVNPYDEEALKRIINYPARGIGQATIDKVRLAAQEAGIGMWEALSEPEHYLAHLSKLALGKLQAFMALMESFRQDVHESDASTAVRRIIEESGIRHDLFSSNTAEDLARQENVQELLNAIQEFVEIRKEEGSGRCDLEAFLHEVSLMSDVDEEGDDDEEKVTMMTVHSAKGLEFRVVFIVGLEENLFPGSMALESKREMEEERRLFYVALTRAEELCFLSYAGNRYRYGKMEFSRPSRFLSEISQECLDKAVGGMGYSRKLPNDTCRVIHTPIKKVEGLRTISQIQRSDSVLSQKPSDGDALTVGCHIEHERFGAGTVVALEGSGENRKATVRFDTMGTKQLLLRFARFKILKS